MEKEIWLPVKEYEGLYEVSNLGRVKSLKRFRLGYKGCKSLVREKILKQNLSSSKYLHVNLSKNNKVTTKQVHKLVAIAFLKHNPNGYNLVCNHIDFCRTNNNVSNIEIVTQRQNANQKHFKSTSKYVGVYFHKSRNNWVSSIAINGKKKYLGSFKSEIDAHKAYQKELNTI